jgi:hypothetical protein
VLNIDLAGAPPTRTDLAAAQADLAVRRRLYALLLIPCFIALVPAAWLTRDSAFGGGLVGLVFSVVTGVLCILLMNSALARGLLAPVTPALCHDLETAMRDPVVARYVEAIQRQGRAVTHREASEIRAHASATIKQAEAQRAAAAWQRVHGKPFENAGQ